MAVWLLCLQALVIPGIFSSPALLSLTLGVYTLCDAAAAQAHRIIMRLSEAQQ